MDDGRLPGQGRGFVTAEEVARRAGVSRSAVSRTFTEGASVSERTRRRVLKAAGELGYRVNRLAQGLISERSTLVGVLGANLQAPYMAAQVDALSQALLREGMQCLLLNAAEAENNITRLIDQILEFRARAIVIMSGAPSSAIVKQCIANGVRVILVNKVVEGAKTDTILADNAAGARLAAELLIKTGCRRPTIISSDEGTASLVQRSDAAAACFRTAGLTPVCWSQGVVSYETGARAARELLDAPGIDGVFCTTDLLALGFLDAARDHGRRVPEDVQVIGFNDIPQASWLAYRLTSIRLPIETLTQAVMEAILREEKTKLLRTLLPLTLVERATTRPTNRA
jgi:DNA-binding LacI/PurR family transcriptional regulator